MSRKIRFLIEAVNQTREPFQEVENGLERLRTTRLEASRVVLEQARAENYLRATYKYQYQAYYDHLGAMKQVGNIGNTLIGIVNQRNIAELRLGDALRDVSEAQRVLNTALDLYGEDSVQYKKATEDLTEAQKRYKKAADDSRMGTVAMALSMTGAIADVGKFILELKKLETLYSTLSTLGSLAVPAALLAPAFLAPFLSTEEQKQQALLNTYQKQGFVSTVMGGGITPGAPGAEDWIDLLRGEIRGIVGETIGGVNPWGTTTTNTADTKTTTTKTTNTVNVYTGPITNQANIDALSRAVEKAMIDAKRSDW